MAAFAARFSFKLKTGSFLAEFFEGDFSFAIIFDYLIINPIKIVKENIKNSFIITIDFNFN
ncbi:hypothetical protein APR40_01215 [Salegentibacter salarius]|uniref:Uncharacterized protein n=1 Tax=Salegentibacter salarius TaxID=435906 RepID=A0A2N0U5K0_9FLAO|nr:hypothetical protein BHS39_01215 [Salegentibacter salarius]PKD22280.1 hypothetical protein APR40_01215 [Salegentibacter salarius]